MKAGICGAGISGLSAAAFLARAGWDVVVAEQAEGPRQQGYMIDFFGPGGQAANTLGIVPRIRELGYRVEQLEYVDTQGQLSGYLVRGEIEPPRQGRVREHPAP